MTREIRSICIVGGGSAGWLTAALIAARHGKDLDVTLVESLSAAPSAWGGHLAHHAQHAAQDRHCRNRFIRACNASFKQGAKFARWRTGKADDAYYHPLVLPEGFPDLDLAPYWNEARQAASPSYSDAVCFQDFLCENGLAPKLITSPEYGGIANYAYHLMRCAGRAAGQPCHEQAGRATTRSTMSS
jgi:hypothetical protein